jgi:hypothetical protein
MTRILGRSVITLALILIPAGPTAFAQTAQPAEESPAAAPSGSPAASVAPSVSSAPHEGAVTHACDVWTAEEVAAALGGGEFTAQPPGAGDPTCSYVGTDTAGGLTEGLMVGFVFGDESTGSLIDMLRQSITDAEELEIGGLVAIPGPSSSGSGDAEGWSMSTLFVFPDPMTMLQLQATTPAGVDGAAALVSLVELAASRIASAQPPAATPSPAVSPATSGEPAPSTAARPGLAGRLPSDIDGNPMAVQADLTGPQYLSQIIDFRPMEQKVTRALKKRDLKAADLSFVIGSTNGGSVVAAFQVEGGAIKPLVNVLLESLAMERTGGDVPSGDVAGKDAFGVTSGFLLGGGDGYAYASEDVLWLVFAFGDEQAHIFEQLP